VLITKISQSYALQLPVVCFNQSFAKVSLCNDFTCWGTSLLTSHLVIDFMHSCTTSWT